MSKPEYNEKNRETLAEEVTDGLDMKTMFNIIYEQQLEYYEQSKEAFYEDWDAMCMEETDA